MLHSSRQPLTNSPGVGSELRLSKENFCGRLAGFSATSSASLLSADGRSYFTQSRWTPEAAAPSPPCSARVEAVRN